MGQSGRGCGHRQYLTDRTPQSGAYQRAARTPLVRTCRRAAGQKSCRVLSEIAASRSVELRACRARFARSARGPTRFCERVPLASSHVLTAPCPGSAPTARLHLQRRRRPGAMTWCWSTRPLDHKPDRLLLELRREPAPLSRDDLLLVRIGSWKSLSEELNSLHTDSSATRSARSSTAASLSRERRCIHSGLFGCT